ncbi:MAG: ABC transporter ATP-binding protein [Frankiaceae bacterium]|nr:ABC transporter ATP-binding protein [Frankiaceae bacterium]
MAGSDGSGLTGPLVRGVAMRSTAALGAAAAVIAVTAAEAAHDEGRVDEAGFVLVGVVALGLLFLAYHLWRGGGVRIAVSRTVAPQVGVRVLPVPTTSAPQRDAIRLDGITVRYGLRLALDDVSLRVGAGEIVGLLGPNGAGKTTTVDVCCGLRRPIAGTVCVLGHDATTSSADLRRSIGVVPQETGLYPELTGAEYMSLFAAMYDVKSSPARIEQVLALMGLWDRRNTRIGGFSGGMKRRLALARALLHDPPVLFLDEPTLGVDVHGRRALWDHVSRLRDEGRSVLLTTNYLEEATALCDRVVILDEGRVLADERPDALRRQSGTTLLLETDGDAQLLARILAERCDVEATVTDGVVAVSLPRDDLTAHVVRVAADAATVTSVRTEQPTLEDVFLRLTGQELRE